MLSFVLFLGIGGMVEVDGDRVCPSPAEVAAQLGTLLPGRAASLHDHARLSGDARALVITLDSAGAPLVERRLEQRGSCADLAAAAAVVIATWETQLHSGVSMRLSGPADPGPPPPLTSLPAPPPVRLALAALPSTVPSSAGPRLSVQVRARPQLRFELGAAFVASFAGGGFAPGGALDTAFAPRGGPWALRLAFTGVSTRELALADGRVSWTRVALGLGPRYRFTVGIRWLFDLHAEAIAALLVANGVGFAINQQSLNFDPGLGAGARVSLRHKMLAPFVGVSIAGWLREQQLAVNGLSSTGSVPRFEVLLSAGVTVGRF